MTEAFHRRQLIAAAGLIAAGTASAAEAQPARAPLPDGPLPLPFDPKLRQGFSEQLLVSHHDNNYVGAVNRLKAIRQELSGLDWATTPGYRINGLKREELIAWNSMILHEIYFAGLAPAALPSRELQAALARDFGSPQRWAAEFSAIGKALGGGSGWVLLTYDRRTRRLVNTWAADHTMTLADGATLVALDMYEHAYHLDFGAKAAAYVDTFMKVLSWGQANAVFREVASA